MKNATNNTNNTAAIIVHPTHAARAFTAHTRHYCRTAAVVTLPEICPTHAAEVMHTAHAAARKALAARYTASGQPLMLALMNAAQADRRREQLPRIAAEAMQQEATHAAAREQADRLAAIAQRISTPAEERREAMAQAKQAAAIADNAAAHAHDLNRTIEKGSSSDAADIAQAAAVAYIVTMRENNWSSDPDSLRAAFRAACTAAGKAIADTAAAQTLSSYRSKWQPLTDEAAAEERRQHPDTAPGKPCRIPFNVKGGNATTNGYYTIQYHSGNAAREKGWYKVLHYVTAPAYCYYEDFTRPEDGEHMEREAAADCIEAMETAPEYRRNNGINAVQDAATADRLQAFIEAANLKDRERNWLVFLLDNTAARAGLGAVSAYYAEAATRAAAAADRARVKAKAAGKTAAAAEKAAERAARDVLRNADKQAEKVRFEAMKDNAANRAGIRSERTAQRTWQRIREAFTAANKAMQEQQRSSHRTPAEREAAAMAAMQRNADRYQRQHRSTTAAPVIVPRLTVYTSAAPWQYYDKAARMYYAKTPLIWHESHEQPQHISAAEAAAAAAKQEQQRKAEHAAHAVDIYFIECRRIVRSKDPAAAATMDTWSAADKTAWYAQEQERKQQEQRRRAAARASGIYGLNTSFEMWQAWSEEERAAHRDFLNSLSK